MTPAGTTSHGTPDTPLLTVRGEAHLHVTPDLARIGITVTARGRDRHTTLDDLTHRNTTALNLVKTCGDAIETLSTSAFALTPELTERGRGERVRNYHGHVHIETELTDFTALAELATRLADLDLTRVEGPWWSLRPDSPVHAQARRQAVADALQRAREYADALGTTLTALTELTDTGTEPPPPGRTAFARGIRRMTPTDTTEPLDLEPPRLHITAEVRAHFTMAPPRL